MTCLSCKHKSNTVEPFWDLSLEFPERYHSLEKQSTCQRSCSLTEMLAKFTETEALEGCIYACNFCNSVYTLSHFIVEPHQQGVPTVLLITVRFFFMVCKKFNNRLLYAVNCSCIHSSCTACSSFRPVVV